MSCPLKLSEYACRAGTTTAYHWGEEINATMANYGGNVGQTSNTGSYGSNPWGFFDMHGNVWEWTADWYGAFSIRSFERTHGCGFGLVPGPKGWFTAMTAVRTCVLLSAQQNPPERRRLQTWLPSRLQTNHRATHRSKFHYHTYYIETNRWAPSWVSSMPPIREGDEITYHLVRGEGTGITPFLLWMPTAPSRPPVSSILKPTHRLIQSVFKPGMNLMLPLKAILR